jgi:hypothetical protein
MDGTAVTPCTSAMAIDNWRIAKRTYFLGSKVGGYFLAACTGHNCGASCYLVGLKNMADANAHYDYKSTPQTKTAQTRERMKKLFVLEFTNT